MTQGHDARAIANEFIKLAQRDGTSLTNMQLQKLPYIAHGWCLAILGEPLINSSPQVWPYGPVYPSLYDSLTRYGSGTVSDYIHLGDPIYGNMPRGNRITAEKLEPLQEALIEKVWREYGGKDGLTLSTLAHQKRTPWCKAKEEYGVYSSIPDDIIREYYTGLLNEVDS